MSLEVLEAMKTNEPPASAYNNDPKLATELEK